VGDDKGDAAAATAPLGEMPMKPRIRAAALAAVFAASVAVMTGAGAAEPIELQWWHAMTSVNAEVVNQIAADFNAAQQDYKVPCPTSSKPR
jgi:ABC-type glycerol-3-phosphate transport system substrate-binding protein